MEKQFPAKLDSLSKVLSIVVLGVVVATGFILSGVGLQGGHPEMMIPPAGVVIILGITALYSVTGYSLDASGLHIFRRGGIRTYPLSQITSVLPVTTKELGFGMRAFGSGGFLGYFGHFAYRNIGKVKLFATDRSKMILLTLQDGRQIIISPEDTAGFLQAAKKAGIRPGAIVTG